MTTAETSVVPKSLAAGAAGAVALTLIHESLRRVIDNPPRMDLVGERVIEKSLRAMDVDPPAEPTLHHAALALDLISNGLFYALVGTGRGVWRRGLILGTIAGLGAVFLPPVLGLGKREPGTIARTRLITFSYYVTGALVAAATSRDISVDKRRARRKGR